MELDTNFGLVVVAIQGDKSKPAIVTYHEAGVNCECAGVGQLCVCVCWCGLTVCVCVG